MAEIFSWIGNNKWSIPAAWLLIASVWAFALAAYDKHAAKRSSERRVKETTLFAVSALGGSVAMLLTMLSVRHKTLHKRFMIGLPVIIILQIASVVALVYFGIISY